MVTRPDGMGAIEFCVLSTLRAAQLLRGCAPRVAGPHKLAVLAQHEIAERVVVRANLLPPDPNPIG